jgi:hypothetical protein
MFTSNGHLIIAKGNVYTKLAELDGNVIIPATLMSIKNKDGKFQSPFVSVGQPTWKSEDGKRHKSYHSIHLDKTAEEQIAKLLPLDMFKTEAKKLAGTDNKSNFQLQKGKWIPVAAAKDEDEELIGDMIGLAKQFVSKADTVTTTQAADSDATVDSILNMK